MSALRILVFLCGLLLVGALLDDIFQLDAASVLRSLDAGGGDERDVLHMIWNVRMVANGLQVHVYWRAFRLVYGYALLEVYIDGKLFESYPAEARVGHLSMSRLYLDKADVLVHADTRNPFNFTFLVTGPGDINGTREVYAKSTGLVDVRAWHGEQSRYRNPHEAAIRVGSRYLRLALTGASFRSPSLSHVFGEQSPFDYYSRYWGFDIPTVGHTMLGVSRLARIGDLQRHVIFDGVPGDFIEAGVWRGGASIYAKGIWSLYNQTERKVWACDSFEGLPRATQPKDHDEWASMPNLAVSLEEVQDNFASYGLLDEGVEFRRGFFVDSMPKLREELLRTGRRISILRLDGDMYESTYDTLFHLYDLVSVGGFVIVDDYQSIAENRDAVNDFRWKHGVDVPTGFESIMDEHSPFWRKTKDVAIQWAEYEKFQKTRTFVRP